MAVDDENDKPPITAEFLAGVDGATAMASQVLAFYTTLVKGGTMEGEKAVFLANTYLQSMFAMATAIGMARSAAEDGDDAG